MGQVSLPDTAMELDRSGIEHIAAFGVPSLQRQLHRQVQKNGETRDQLANRHLVQLPDDFQVQASAVPLVRQGGSGMPVADHGCPVPEAWTDDGADKLGPGGLEEEQFTQGSEVLMAFQPASNRVAAGSASRFPGRNRRVTFTAQPPQQVTALGALTRPVAAFEYDQGRHDVIIRACRTLRPCWAPGRDWWRPRCNAGPAYAGGGARRNVEGPA